jgi:hypothetical protein
MPRKNKRVNNKVVHSEHKLSDWDDLIGLAKRNIILANVRKDELEAAISIYGKETGRWHSFPRRRIGKLWFVKGVRLPQADSWRPTTSPIPPATRCDPQVPLPPRG